MLNKKPSRRQRRFSLDTDSHSLEDCKRRDGSSFQPWPRTSKTTPGGMPGDQLMPKVPNTTLVRSGHLSDEAKGSPNLGSSPDPLPVSAIDYKTGQHKTRRYSQTEIDQQPIIRKALDNKIDQQRYESYRIPNQQTSPLKTGPRHLPWNPEDTAASNRRTINEWLKCYGIQSDRDMAKRISLTKSSTKLNMPLAPVTIPRLDTVPNTFQEMGKIGDRLFKTTNQTTRTALVLFMMYARGNCEISLTIRTSITGGIEFILRHTDGHQGTLLIR